MKTMMQMKKTIIASSLALAFGATGKAEAIQVFDVLGLGLGVNMYTDSANLTMLAGNGGVVSGTNDVSMVWNGNMFTSDTDYTGPGGPANITASTTTPFFGHTWTAHDIQVFAPGTYSFDTSIGGGTSEAGTISATVPLGSFGVHMLFDWNGSYNIDVFVVAKFYSIYGSGLAYSTQKTAAGNSKCDANFTGTIVTNCLYDGGAYGSAGQPAGNHTWLLASVDGNGDGIMGIPMAAGGPFAGFNATFNVDMSPLPPSGVTGLLNGLQSQIGTLRRKK